MKIILMLLALVGTQCMSASIAQSDKINKQLEETNLLIKKDLLIETEIRPSRVSRMGREVPKNREVRSVRMTEKDEKIRLIRCDREDRAVKKVRELTISKLIKQDYFAHLIK
jgi:hypothetical protein